MEDEKKDVEISNENTTPCTSSCELCMNLFDLSQLEKGRCGLCTTELNNVKLILRQTIEYNKVSKNCFILSFVM